MSYRDQLAAARERIKTLEEQLEELDDKVAASRRGGEAALPKSSLELLQELGKRKRKEAHTIIDNEERLRLRDAIDTAREEALLWRERYEATRRALHASQRQRELLDAYEHNRRHPPVEGAVEADIEPLNIACPQCKAASQHSELLHGLPFVLEDSALQPRAGWLPAWCEICGWFGAVRRNRNEERSGVR